MRVPIINYGNPVNVKHPLMRSLVSRWRVLPQRIGGLRFWDLLRTNHCTLTNGPVWAGTMGSPRGNGCLSFDGSDDYCTANIPAMAFEQTQPFSIALWLKLTTNTDNRWVMTRYSTATNTGWGLRRFNTSPTNSIGFMLRNGVASQLENVAACDTTNWHHWVWTWNGNGAGTASGLIGYMDGAAVSLTNSGNTLAGNTIVPASANFNFASRGDGNGPAQCLIDDAMVFSRELSAGDAAQLYFATRQQYDPTLNWVRRRSRKAAAAPTGNRRRRVICGASA